MSHSSSPNGTDKILQQWYMDPCGKPIWVAWGTHLAHYGQHIKVIWSSIREKTILISLSDSNQYWAGGEGCGFIFPITQRLKQQWFWLCECKQLYVPYVISTWALIPMWHLHGQYAQIEPTCDPFSLVCWGYFSSSKGPSQQIFSHAGMDLLGLNQH